MSLYADILASEYVDEDEDIRQEGVTWTVCCWHCEEEIPGFPDREMALAVARTIRHAYQSGISNGMASS